MKLKRLLCAGAAAAIMMTLPLGAAAEDDYEDFLLGEDYDTVEVGDYDLYVKAEENDNNENSLIPYEYASTRTMPDHRLKERLVDDADLLSDSEESALLSKLNSISEKYSMDVAVVTTYSLGTRTATEFADDYYDYNGFADDGILFLIGMENRDWAISTKGEGIPDFTDYGQELMMDQVKPKLSSGDYNGAFNLFADLSDDYINEARTKEPYDYGHKPKGPFRIIWAIGSFVIGAIVALIYCSKHKAALTSVGMQRDADNYFVKNSFRLTNQSDTFLYKKTSKTRIESDSDRSGGGGGSSSHISSSGSSHGGSSGHF